MTKWECLICGSVSEGERPPERCPVCMAPAFRFRKREADSLRGDELCGMSGGQAPADAPGLMPPPSDSPGRMPK